MIISHNHPKYKQKQRSIGKGRFNGAYYYSVEICRYIIPFVRTDRNWITIGVPNIGVDHSIVFIHNNLHPEHYEWLRKYDDLILVCGVPETVSKVSHIGKAIYLPLSVKVSEIEPYRTVKTKDTAYVGRKGKRYGVEFPVGTDFIEGLPREKLLAELAKYRRVYAVGRTAIEAKILDCEILPYDERFPDPSIWKVIDSSDAAKMLQKQIDWIDKKGTGKEADITIIDEGVVT